MVKTVADGLDSGLQIVDAPRATCSIAIAPCSASPAGAPGRHATLEELFAGEPDSAQAFFRLNRAAERGEPRDEEFYVRSRACRGGAGRWLQVSGASASGAQRVPSGRLTLWQVADVTRERAARDRDGRRPGGRRSPSTTICRRGCSP